MHAIVATLSNELIAIADAIDSSISSNAPFNVAHNNWTFPGISKLELVDMVRTAAAEMRAIELEISPAIADRLQSYIGVLDYIRNQTVPNIWGNPAAGVSVLLRTLEGLRSVYAPVRMGDGEAAQELARLTSNNRRRNKAIEARLNEIEPSSERLEVMVSKIEQAYAAADTLPTDLDQLNQDRLRMAVLLQGATEDKAAALLAKKDAEKFAGDLVAKVAEADAVLAKCHRVYAAATSQGLAAAFADRSKTLNHSMWIWVAGMVAALSLGSWFASGRLHDLAEALKNPQAGMAALIVSMVLALVSIGAPVWFGWLATKQINQRFRLAEDYAFKASVSQAYEGYRREAESFDKDMAGRLLASALTRFDEQPLRFVESDTHGSPWHELLSSQVVKEAIATVPDFAEKVRSFALSTMDRKLGAGQRGDNAEQNSQGRQSGGE